jgi:hypothetical protein
MDTGCQLQSRAKRMCVSGMRKSSDEFMKTIIPGVVEWKRYVAVRKMLEKGKGRSKEEKKRHTVHP